MLTLKICDLDDVTVFHCKGRITCDERELLRDAVVARSHSGIVVLDLAEISTVDASGLGILVFLRTWTAAAGKQLKLTNLAPRVEEIFALTKLKAVFQIGSLELASAAAAA